MLIYCLSHNLLILSDCSVSNGDCEGHACQIMNGTATFSECICKDGFDKSFWWDYCHGSSPFKCNATLSTCNNTEGSYECKRKAGFQSDVALNCIGMLKLITYNLLFVLLY